MKKSPLPALLNVIFALSLTTVSYAQEITQTSGDSTIFRASELADSIIREATKMSGTPYRYGSAGPKTFDCSGFTWYIYNKFNINLLRSSRGQGTQGIAVEGPISNLQKGDLVLFSGRKISSTVGHVGIFIGLTEDKEDFTFIHAAVKGGVQISKFSEPYYSARFIGARRILPRFNNIDLDTTATISNLDTEHIIIPATDIFSFSNEQFRATSLYHNSSSANPFWSESKPSNH